MKLLPFHSLPFPLLLLDKGLDDPSLACSYQLARKMDSNISKVCASMADLLSSSSWSLLMLFLKFSCRRKMPHQFSGVSMIRTDEIRMRFCSEVHIKKKKNPIIFCEFAQIERYAKLFQEWEWRSNAIEGKDNFGKIVFYSFRIFKLF